jgi:hypothetical protein
MARNNLRHLLLISSLLLFSNTTSAGVYDGVWKIDQYEWDEYFDNLFSVLPMEQPPIYLSFHEKNGQVLAAILFSSYALLEDEPNTRFVAYRGELAENTVILTPIHGHLYFQTLSLEFESDTS